MVSKVPIGLEAFIAVIEAARVRLLPGVNSHVSFQIALFVESLGAELT